MANNVEFFKASAALPWRKLKTIVLCTRQLLIQQPSPESMHQSNIRLIENLAFLYRYHLLNLALKVLAREGDAKCKLDHIRTVLVHHADSHVLNVNIISQTRAALQQLPLDELYELSCNKMHLDAVAVKDAMVKMPLHQLLLNLPEVHPNIFSYDDIHDWITEYAIPVINTITAIRAGYDREKQNQCDDAIKMMIIIIGEYCPRSRIFDVHHFTLANSGTYAGFLLDCRILRNFYAHSALTHAHDVHLADFVAATQKINSQTIQRDLHQPGSLLEPHKTKISQETHHRHARHRHHHA